MLSTEFVTRFNLPFNVIPAGLVVRRVASGPVVVPTSTGNYVCSFPMEVGHVASRDVVGISFCYHGLCTV